MPEASAPHSRAGDGAVLAAHRQRIDKMRLDFNENTVGCSPARDRIPARSSCARAALPSIPITRSVKQTLAAFFKVAPDELLLTNGTDEAIQVLVNTYVDDGDEVIILRPSYAMYRFYAEVAGAKIVEVDYQPPARRASRSKQLLARDHAAHARDSDLESEQSDRHRDRPRRQSNRS